jgi:hypothetical protein
LGNKVNLSVAKKLHKNQTGLPAVDRDAGRSRNLLKVETEVKAKGRKNSF